MSCSCSACTRWTILIIGVFFLISAVFFFMNFAYQYNDQPWFKPIRNQCIPFYLSIISVVFMSIYSFIGVILCCAKEKKLYVTYLTLILITIFLNIAIIILTLCFEDQILYFIEKNWKCSKYRKNRLEFEATFQCCGFYNYNPKEECGFKGLKGYLCGDIVKIELNAYLAQIRKIVIYFISIEILPLILASVLNCCNDEEKEAEHNELESTTSLYNALIN
ncbi:hypothetical protein M9Y10_023830 [Tritrichomonas musculus]|uniref:Tetraspanin family protein n=1 Tax=Tritrichomonas musculus TaxID=1915356 RepID=A0ABR2KY26_9EUKA